MSTCLFSAKREFRHQDRPTIGVLISNLGTPDAPTPAALKTYLAEFLSDPRVIELPRWQWLPILKGIVLNTRPKRSAELYRSIWTEEGSPLLVISKHQREKLQARLSASFGARVVTALGMRYGNPSIASALEQLREAGAERIFVLPLYPQYSASTTGSTFDALADALKDWRWVPELRFKNSYHDEPLYIQALAETARAAFELHGKPEKLLFSFHGVPKRYFENGDPYYCHCQKTGRLVAEALGLSAEEYLVSFQSLFGKEEWIRPYTDETLEALAKSGVNSVHVMCPGFSADCLETIEEIDAENRENFLHAGGRFFHYIPALNDSDSMVALMEKLVLENISDWAAKPDDNRAAQAAAFTTTGAAPAQMNSR